MELCRCVSECFNKRYAFHCSQTPDFACTKRRQNQGFENNSEGIEPMENMFGKDFWERFLGK